MSQKEDFIEIKDIDSIKRALENAEIDYEEVTFEDTIRLEVEGSNVCFYFDENGTMNGLEP